MRSNIFDEKTYKFSLPQPSHELQIQYLATTMNPKKMKFTIVVIATVNKISLSDSHCT